jgi:hypothetical protein
MTSLENCRLEGEPAAAHRAAQLYENRDRSWGKAAEGYPNDRVMLHHRARIMRDTVGDRRS